MPYCPQCKKNIDVFVTITVNGILYPEDDIDAWPDVQIDEAACPDSDVECAECEYEGKLKEFRKNEKENSS